jgi:hypothetical protein
VHLILTTISRAEEEKTCSATVPKWVLPYPPPPLHLQCLCRLASFSFQVCATQQNRTPESIIHLFVLFLEGLVYGICFHILTARWLKELVLMTNNLRFFACILKENSWLFFDYGLLDGNLFIF